MPSATVSVPDRRAGEKRLTDTEAAIFRTLALASATSAPDANAPTAAASVEVSGIELVAACEALGIDAKADSIRRAVARLETRGLVIRDSRDRQLFVKLADGVTVAGATEPFIVRAGRDAAHGTAHDAGPLFAGIGGAISTNGRAPSARPSAGHTGDRLAGATAGIAAADVAADLATVRAEMGEMRDMLRVVVDAVGAGDTRNLLIEREELRALVEAQRRQLGTQQAEIQRLHAALTDATERIARLEAERPAWRLAGREEIAGAGAAAVEIADADAAVETAVSTASSGHTGRPSGRPSGGRSGQSRRGDGAGKPSVKRPKVNRTARAADAGGVAELSRQIAAKVRELAGADGWADNAAVRDALGRSGPNWSRDVRRAIADGTVKRRGENQGIQLKAKGSVPS